MAGNGGKSGLMPSRSGAQFPHLYPENLISSSLLLPCITQLIASMSAIVKLCGLKCYTTSPHFYK